MNDYQVICVYVQMIRSNACLATKTQQLYLHSSHVQHQSRTFENLQNRQNSAVSLAPRHNILISLASQYKWNIHDNSIQGKIIQITLYLHVDCLEHFHKYFGPLLQGMAYIDVIRVIKGVVIEFYIPSSNNFNMAKNLDLKHIS